MWKYIVRAALNAHHEDAMNMKQDLTKKKSKREHLRTLDCFVMDNSIRESTVGQLRGHTLENKLKIYEEVKKCGFKHIIVASFAHMTKVDDFFLEELVKRNEDMSTLYSFSDLVSMPIKNGIPDTATIPIGLAKMSKFGLQNPIFEIDLADSSVDYEKFTVEKLCDVLLQRMEWTLKNLSKEANIFVNFRDFPPAMEKAPERVFSVVSFLAKQSQDFREHIGIMYEEPTGNYLPEEMGQWTKSVRKVMDTYQWKGHLLVHVHKKWGSAETVQLKCLMKGADGIWASVCEEGAAMGHACSAVTLMNLVRMGNKTVLENYNCAYLRTAARNITIFTTGKDVHPKQVVYGERALDVAFSFGGIAGGVVAQDEFDMANFFGEKRLIRVGTLTSLPMIVQTLEENFGEHEDFTEERAKEMKKVIIEDLKTNRKEEYTSKVGLALLYDRSGGKITTKMRDEVEKIEITDPHSKQLIADVRKIWDEWDSREEEVDDNCLQYDTFYNGFMAPYFSCYRCDDTKRAMQAIDMDCDGYVEWSEFSLYLKWAVNEYSDISDADELISIAFRKGIIPAMQDEILKQDK